MKVVQKDVLIVGSGLAGLYTSLHLDQDLSVGVVSKDRFDKSNSQLAQGGIASCISTEDSFDDHMEDTLVAGNFVNNVDAVSMLVEKAPGEIHRLIELGVEFDTDEEGMVLTTLEGGHSYRRVLHANGDATGKAIMESVLDQTVRRRNIEIFEKTMAVKIEKDSSSGDFDVIVLNDKEYICIRAKAVVIATGGVGALYKNTTNQMFSTGDGIALAKDAGCKLVDMCFVQFHPTAFYGEEINQRFLITEAVRGEGGILRNEKNEAFMERYDRRKDLAPRDVVARSIFTEMGKDGTEHVWLDITHHDKHYLESRFPTVYGFLKDQGIYMEKDMIPVAPVAHYFVGGIEADLYGRTSVDGIYACGEVSSTGVHGANRLASNSLLECVVFGKRCAIHINRTVNDRRTHINSVRKIRIAGAEYDREVCDDKMMNDCHFEDYMKSIQDIMTAHVGIVRTDEGLDEAYLRIESIYNWIRHHDRVCTMYHQVMNMCVVAMEIIMDAKNKDSIGCHYKEKKSLAEVV